MTDELLRVGVIGARGRMGQATCQAVVEAEDMDLVAAVDARDWLFSVADADSQVVVDFTHPDGVMDNIRFCIDHNIHAVVGTSGFTDERLDTIGHWLAAKPDLGIMVVPNFAIGAVLDRPVRPRGRPVLRIGGGHRTAPHRQGGRAVGHRGVHRQGHRGRPQERRVG